MKKYIEIFKSPLAKIILRGCIKALVIIPIASMLLGGVLMFQTYGTDFDKHIRPFGTAYDFFRLGSGFIALWSIPVALFTIVIFAFFIRHDGIKKRIYYKRSFFVGMTIGFLMAWIEITLFFGGLVPFFQVILFPSIAGGILGLWMARDTIKLYGDV